MQGNKASNLIKLRDNGFNVPEFDVVSEEDINKYNPSFMADFYSVRSSCSLEDGDELSFAGQFDTFLNVKYEDINAKIVECFNSMSEEKVGKLLGASRSYSKNVIVQKMIFPDVSGVIFTSNPQGLLNEMVISCGRGYGDNVVQDKGEEVTSYYYNTTDDVYYYEGTEDLLDRSKIKNILDTSNKMKSIFGEYIDIEFSLVKDTLYVLQVRKITTIDGTNLLVFDNSNIVESYPGISSPLTISFAKYIYKGVFKSAISRVLKNETEIEKLQDVFENMVGSCNGRLYYKISNWYEIILRLPFKNKIIPIWQDMMGVKDSKVYKNSKYTKRVNLFVYLNFLKTLKDTPKLMHNLQKTFENVYKEYKENDINCLSKNDIIELFYSVSTKLFSEWDVTLFNDLYTFIYTGKLKEKLKKHNSDYEEIVNRIISGNKNIESLKPITELIILSKKKNVQNTEIENTLYDTDLLDGYKTAFNEYVEKYGDRTIEELKLETCTFRTNPELLEQKIEEYNLDRTKYEKMLLDIKGGIDENSHEFDYDKIAIRAKGGIRNREQSRLNRARIFGMCREMFLRIGSILRDENKIESQRDIFYLTIDEIFDSSKESEYKEIINDRKEKYELYKKLPSYTKLIFDGKEFDKNHNFINNESLVHTTDTLNGIPCSNGICEGEAIVVDGTNSQEDVKDKIIVAKMTDPGWVFLIASSKGIISEKGSILSHTAIITRELKIPSIVGVKDLLKNVKTGDRIYMDANKGIVKIIEAEK